MDNDVEKGIELMQKASRMMQEEFGHVMSGTRNIVNFPNNPNNAELRPRIQKQVDGLVQGSLLLYLFAIWEDITTERMRTFLNDEEKKKLRAYRHIRHSVGHRFSGGRADMYREEFEELHNTGQLKCISWNQEDDTIDLSGGNVAMECQQFMSHLAQQLTARVAHETL